MSTPTTGQRTPSAAPRYLQIADDLRIAIEAGALAPGDQLPSLQALAEQYGVSVAVARQAIQLLRSQALITTASGKPATVREARARSVYSNKAHWEKRERAKWPEAKRRNHGTIEDEIGLSIRDLGLNVDYQRVPADARETPEWPAGTELLRREYETTKEGRRIARTLSYIPVYLIEGNPDLFESANEPWPGGIHHQLSTVGVLFGRFEDTVTVHVPTTVEIEKWGLSPGEALIEMRSVGWSEDDLEGQPAFVNRIWYPAETTALKFITDVPRRV